MKIIHSNNFSSDFIEEKLGSGQVSVENGVLKTTGTKNGDRALKAFYMNNKGVTKIKVSVLARAVSGVASIALDGGNSYISTSNIAIAETSSKSWTKLELEAFVPDSFSVCKITIGRFAGQNEQSETYFKNIVIESEDQMLGVPKVLAQGLARIQNGVATLRPAYRSFGISKIEYLPSTKETVLYLDSPIVSGEYGTYPIVNITGTQDNFIIPLAGGFNGKEIYVKYTDGTQFIDISDKTVYFSFSVQG